MSLYWTFFCIWFLKHLVTYSRWRLTLTSTFIFSQFFHFWVQTFYYMLSMWSCSRKSRILLTVPTCTAAVHSFQNPICTSVFLLFTATCFSACVHDMYDTINSHLTQIFMRATVNVRTMLLDFFYLRVSNYQLSSSPSDYKFCYMFLCTCVYKISKLVHNPYRNFARLQKQECSCI